MSTKNNTRFLERPPLFNAVFNNDILDMLTAIDRQFGTDFAPVYWEPFRGNKMIPNPTNSNLDLPTNKTGLNSNYREINNNDGNIWVHGTYPKLRIIREANEDRILEKLHILAAVPGVPKEDVSVFMEGAKITIEIKPEPVTQEDAQNDIKFIVLNEIPKGKNRVEIGLNGPFDVESSTAEFKDNGMLEIIVPVLKKKQRVNILGK